MEFETVIGLEIHAQLKTESKIFCGCSTRFGEYPNTQTCPVCLGLPGSLPVLNKRVVEFAVRVGLALNATVNRESVFARKNYFYPDLPKGYQTSQFDRPIVEHGHVDITVDGQTRRIGITRAHMEEDAGKLLHDPSEPVSYVDLNRTGTPLLEIVSEPDLRSPAEAAAYLRKIHAIMRYLDVCDGNMQEGSFRCDANISLRPKNQMTFGTRTELKNMNSFRNVQAALEYEERRQRDILLEGEQVIQQTLLWNPDSGKTESMRGKEDAHDYRYFPCPDLIPVVIAESVVIEASNSMPELPDDRRHRFIKQYGLTDYDANRLTEERELAEYFEAVLDSYDDAKKTANWIITELLKELQGAPITACPVSPQQLADLLRLITQDRISGKIGKTVFTEMMESGEAPMTIIESKNLVQVSDESALLAIVQEIISSNPSQVEEYRAGKEKLIGYFVGQVMQRTKGKANPKIVNQLLIKNLAE